MRRSGGKSLATALAIVLVGLATSSCASSQVEPDIHGEQAARPELDGFIQDTMAQWRVPGAAVAIVTRDDVLYAKGYGVLDIVEGGEVTPDTVFAIGSNGKSFTSVMLGALQDEGVLRLSDPVTSVLADFQMSSPESTAAITFENALAHTSGLPAQSGLGAWYLMGAGQTELVDSIRHVPVEAPVGESFLYNNSMFAVAAEAAEKATEKNYATLIQSYIFDPLKMSRSSTSLAITGEANVAKPHAFSGGSPVRVPFHATAGAVAAGSVNASLHDMTRFVRMMLHDGSLDGAKVLSAQTAAQVQSLRRPFKPGEMAEIGQIVQGLEDPSRVGTFGYGLGLGVLEYAGSQYAMHGGSIDGMTSWMMWSRERNIGVIVLTNSGNMVYPALAAFAALNPEIGLPLDQALVRMAPMRDMIIGDPPAPAASEDPAVRPVSDLAGHYSNLLGGFTIRAEAGAAKLVFDKTGYTGTVASLGGANYWVDLDNPALIDFGLTLAEGDSAAPLRLTEMPSEYPALFPADPDFVRQTIG